MSCERSQTPVKTQPPAIAVGVGNNLNIQKLKTWYSTLIALYYTKCIIMPHSHKIWVRYYDLRPILTLDIAKPLIVAQLTSRFQLGYCFPTVLSINLQQSLYRQDFKQFFCCALVEFFYSNNNLVCEGYFDKWVASTAMRHNDHA